MKMFIIGSLFMFILFNLAPQNVITVLPRGVFAEIDTSSDNKMMNDLYSRDYNVLKNAVHEVYQNINKYSPPVIYTFAYVLFINGKKKEKDEAVKWLFVGMIRA